MLHKSCAKTLLLFFRLPPGYPRKKAARFFMPDGFLRNVIAQIIFFVGVGSEKPWYYSVPIKTHSYACYESSSYYLQHRECLIWRISAKEKRCNWKNCNAS